MFCGGATSNSLKQKKNSKERKTAATLVAVAVAMAFATAQFTHSSVHNSHFPVCRISVWSNNKNELVPRSSIVVATQSSTGLGLSVSVSFRFVFDLRLFAYFGLQRLVRLGTSKRSVVWAPPWPKYLRLDQISHTIILYAWSVINDRIGRLFYKNLNNFFAIFFWHTEAAKASFNL